MVYIGVLNIANYNELSAEAIKKVKENYSQTRVATQYIDIYKKALTNSNYK